MTPCTPTASTLSKNCLSMMTIAKSVAMCAKRSRVQMKTILFNLFDPTSIKGYLSTFKHVYDTNGIQEGADIWLLPLFMEKTVAAVLTARTVLYQTCKYCKDGTLSSYYKEINYLLETFATEHIFVKWSVKLYESHSCQTWIEWSKQRLCGTRHFGSTLSMMSTSWRGFLLNDYTDRSGIACPLAGVRGTAPPFTTWHVIQ